MSLQKLTLNFTNICAKNIRKGFLHTNPQNSVFGLKRLHTLNDDIVQISNSAQRWHGKLEQYIPDCSITHCSIPSHHKVDGLNPLVRNIDCFKNGDVDIFEIDGAYRAVFLDNEFARLAPLEKDCLAYRGVQRGWNEYRDKAYRIVSNAKVGDIIVPDQGFGYAAHKIDLAERFLGDGGMLYTIRVPRGARVSRNLEHGGEILMPRGAEYRLISKQLRSDGKMDVTLEYILPKSIIPEDIPQIKRIAEQYVESTDEFFSKNAKKILEEIEKLEGVTNNL